MKQNEVLLKTRITTLAQGRVISSSVINDYTGYPLNLSFDAFTGIGRFVSV